jgi:type IV pilus assembly protein PilA
MKAKDHQVPAMRQKRNGFSLVELLVVVAIILIIAAIAIPNLMASRQRANEAAAVSTLRTLHTSQSAYNSTYGEIVGFAGHLSQLGPAPTCDQNHSCLVDDHLGCASEPCLRGGYLYYMASDSSAAPFLDYAFSATPLSWKGSGTRNFCSAEDGMIRFEVGASGPLSAAVQHTNCLNFALYDGI